MDSDKFDSLLDLEDFSDIYASIYGDTDKDNYRRIVWDGLYPSY